MSDRFGLESDTLAAAVRATAVKLTDTPRAPPWVKCRRPVCCINETDNTWMLVLNTAVRLSPITISLVSVYPIRLYVTNSVPMGIGGGGGAGGGRGLGGGSVSPGGWGGGGGLGLGGGG